MPDFAKAMAILNLLAPVVPTGGGTGKFNKFDTTQGFKQYSQAVLRRAMGGAASRISLLEDSANYSADPYGLSIAIDDHERTLAGDGGQALLEQAKTRTLMAQAIGNFANDAYTILKAGRSAHATLGKWSDPNVDPIDEIEAAAIEIYEATGMWPNKVDITPQMWRYLKKNALTLKRFGGKNASMKMEDVGAEAGGFDMQMVTGAGLASGDFGQSAPAFTPMLGTACWIYYSNPLATGDNATFACTLAVDEDLLTNVYEYMSSDGTQRFLRIPWFTKPVVVSAALARRIVYSA
jgi:hypothetical protein